jgi:hypothetical protein
MFISTCRILPTRTIHAILERRGKLIHTLEHENIQTKRGSVPIVMFGSLLETLVVTEGKPVSGKLCVANAEEKVDE